MKRSFAILVTSLTAVASQVQGQQSTSQQLPMMHMAGILGLVETMRRRRS